MNLYTKDLYLEDLNKVANLDLPWSRLKDKKIMVSGATGLIGSFLIDVLMKKNNSEGLNCTLYALGRSVDRIRSRFSNHIDSPNFVILQYDVINPMEYDSLGMVDYVLHLASNTHPLLYSKDPISTILINVEGVKNMLDFSCVHHTTRFLFASSNEMYGENRGDVEFFEEDYCGYINCRRSAIFNKTRSQKY